MSTLELLGLLVCVAALFWPGDWPRPPKLGVLA